MPKHLVYKLLDNVNYDKVSKNITSQCRCCSKMLKGSARRFSSHFIKEYRAGYALCTQLSTISVKDINTVRVHEGYDALPVPVHLFMMVGRM
ncbi:hypothetical protein P9112_004392 [Eukaryota sp. TZLM1-RC]